MTTATESATKVVQEYAEPALAAVEAKMRDVRRDVRRAVTAGRHAVEDYADEATIQVRRHPFAALTAAAGVGTLIGGIVGFTIGWCSGRPAR